MTTVDSVVRDLQDVIRSLQGLDEDFSKRPVLGSFPRDYPSQFSHSDWECEDSPTRYCMYTHYSTYDACIFCGDPDERK